MNGSLIKTPSVCMSHTDIEATNNESSELDQSDDELTKKYFNRNREFLLVKNAGRKNLHQIHKMQRNR